MSSSMSGGKGFGKFASMGGGGGDIIPKGYNKGQINNWNPEQSQIFKNSVKQVSPDSYTSRLAAGDQSLFEEMEAPANRQFNETLSGIADRFSQAGTGGRHSSAFQNATTAAGSNFIQDLQSRRGELQRNAIADLMGMSHQLLGERQYDKFIAEKPQKPNYWGQIGGALAGAIPGAIGGFMKGGPPGAVAGGLSSFAANAATSGNQSNWIYK